MPVVVRIPAGRSARREGTNYVDADYELGYLELDQLDLTVLELRWVDKETGEIRDRLMLEPGVSTFSEVAEDDTGRTYVLDFKHCPEKFFYWLQRADIYSELRNIADLNGYMKTPYYTRGTTDVAERLYREPQDTECLGTSFVEADIARLLVLWAGAGVLNSTSPYDPLYKQVTSEDVIENVAYQPDLIRPLKALFPYGTRFPRVPTPQSIYPILWAPELADAISCLETVLQESGLPPTLMYELGLRQEDGWDLTVFMRALESVRPRGDEVDDASTNSSVHGSNDVDGSAPQSGPDDHSSAPIYETDNAPENGDLGNDDIIDDRDKWFEGFDLEEDDDPDDSDNIFDR